MSHDLTGEQRAFFDENGYLILAGAFSPEEVGKMRYDADRILELIINSSDANGRKSGRLDIRELPDGQHVVRKIQPINDLGLFLAEVSRDDRLLQPMRRIMGDEPVLLEEKLNYKQPLLEPLDGMDVRKFDDRFPIHNDWAYYRAQNYPQEIISSAICLDDVHGGNGTLRVWPGSHKEHLEHEAMDNGLQVLPGLVDFEGGIDVVAPAGSVLLFHSLLVHNSFPNDSGRPRRIMIYSHYPEKANMGFDVRNGPGRLNESPWEWEYQRRKDRGEYVDRFRAPVYS